MGTTAYTAGSSGIPGFAWAAKRSARWKKLACLIDHRAILGQGDWHMASALVEAGAAEPLYFRDIRRHKRIPTMLGVASEGGRKCISAQVMSVTFCTGLVNHLFT